MRGQVLAVVQTDEGEEEAQGHGWTAQGLRYCIINNFRKKNKRKDHFD